MGGKLENNDVKGFYNIIYSDTEISDVIVNLEETNEPEILSLENGGVFAVRE